MDRLSNLPSGIIELILCRVPIQEAGRTSILSKEWRYRWTRIPNLVFIEDTFQVSTVDGAESSILGQTHEQPNNRLTMDRKSKLIYAICQVLLIHDGPINEFTLSLCLSRKHVDPILTYLSRKTRVRKLKFDFVWPGHPLPRANGSGVVQSMVALMLLNTTNVDIYVLAERVDMDIYTCKDMGSLQEERWCELVKEVADDLLLKSFSFLNKETSCKRLRTNWGKLHKEVANLVSILGVYRALSRRSENPSGTLVVEVLANVIHLAEDPYEVVYLKS
ncbi:F-box/FBD/LRR-repeat protein [Tanacetum coccineum]